MNSILCTAALLFPILAVSAEVGGDPPQHIPPGLQQLAEVLPDHVFQTILESLGVGGQMNNNHHNGHSSNLPHGVGHGQGLLNQLPRGGGSSGVSLGDFNGDGFGDLAIGVPLKDITVTDQGEVIVIYGSATGLNTSTTAAHAAQVWTQGSPGMPDPPRANDSFGSTVLAGDFNGDGFSDLAVGAQEITFRSNGQCLYGTVTVIYGSAQGLTTNTNAGVPQPQLLSLWDVQVPEVLKLLPRNLASSLGACPSASPTFGLALAWGDFNADGFGDLAVGDIRAAIDFFSSLCCAKKCGVVAVFYGSAGGLQGAGSQLLSPLLPSISQNPSSGRERIAEDDELFGATLAAGDFNADGRTDLAVGAPAKDYGGSLFERETGMVMVFYARSNNAGFSLNPLDASVFSKGNDPALSEGLGGTPRGGEQFGDALAAGDFDGDGRSDLAIGIPGEKVGTLLSAGAVNVIYSRLNGGVFRLGVPANQFWTQSSIFGNPSSDSLGGKTEAFDRFGLTLTAGDFNADGFKDLAIGTPVEGVLVNGSNRPEAGEVDVIYGSASRLSIAARAPQRFRQSDTGGAIETGDHFGTSLTAWNFGRNETISNPPISLTFRTSDLAIGIPREDIGSIVNAGRVDVLYGNKLTSNGLSSTGAQGWHLNVAGVPGTCVAGDWFGSALY